MHKSSPGFRPPAHGHRVRVSIRAAVRSPARAYWLIYNAAQRTWEIDDRDKIQGSQPETHADGPAQGVPGTKTLPETVPESPARICSLVNAPDSTRR